MDSKSCWILSLHYDTNDLSRISDPNSHALEGKRLVSAGDLLNAGENHVGGVLLE